MYLIYTPYWVEELATIIIRIELRGLLASLDVTMTTHNYDDDDIPKLPGDTIAALQEFYTERELSAKRFEELKAGLDGRPQILSMNMFMEDWNASQFWVWISLVQTEREDWSRTGRANILHSIAMRRQFY